MKALRCMLLLASLAVFVPGGVSAPAETRPAPADQVPSAREMADIRQEVETLRGKKFRQEVPARTISEEQLRAIIARDLAKDYPGRKLADLQELMVWLDFLPPKTDLRTVCADLLVDQVAGLYDTETKVMCIPSQANAHHQAAKNPSQKKLEELPGFDQAIVFVHEYTHALEDQYWPLDDPRDKQSQASTDRDVAHEFLAEGSATRLMVEALPAQLARGSPATYITVWNLLHSGVGEAVLDYLLSQVWKGSDVEVPGVPETLARGEAMPYSFGYSFCRKIMRDWGLDGLDYIYDHPPVSSEQVLHPAKCWEWRDFPVQVSLPQTLPGGWKLLTDDTLGEAGMALLFGCQLKNLNRGLRLASGWDGDRAALYEAPDGGRLLAWAGAWDSVSAAERFAGACAQERRLVHHATLTKKPGQPLAWTRPDGRAGFVRREGKRVLLLETDKPEALAAQEVPAGAFSFTEPPEDAARAAANRSFLRFNPLLSWQKDGDYAVTRSLWGLLWRHDRNTIGAADRLLLGILGEWRRTPSYSKWKLGWSLAARHQSEARRGISKTTLLPWGMLWSHFSAALPQAPTNTVSRATVLWGLAGSRTSVRDGRQTLSILPGGLLFRSTTGPGTMALHVLGTGVSRRQATRTSGAASHFRLLGIPLWTTHPAPPPPPGHER